MSEAGDKETGMRRSRSKYIDPMVDGGFKILFGSEKTKELTESLLSSILGFEVADLTFLNTEQIPDTVMEKSVRYDILCEDDSGNKYLLEMQVQSHAGLLERTFYYIGRCLSSQLGIGDKYGDLKGVYGIFLTWCGIGDDTGDFIKDFRMVNVLNMSEKIDEIRQIFINLKKFDKDVSECGTMMDKWLYNLKNMNRKDDVAFAEREEVFRKLKKYAAESNMTPDEKILYDLRVDSWYDYYRYLDESMERGVKRGVEQGMNKAKVDIARSLKALDVPVETIMQATGLSSAEISDL